MATPQKNGRARMADVARKAGVALVTVSRAFSDPDKVSSETRARIAAAAAELGYVPNLLAGSLASSRSRIIAMT
ncbi:MAG: LacI family DNA-binding transcriptional regulator, partial [Kiloniellales bacterium]|nr:LacI family DNA-binding transcriptional regulator [Kiloniellales bacterium]